jgi:hypothetical protein
MLDILNPRNSIELQATERRDFFDLFFPSNVSPKLPIQPNQK